MRQLVDIHDIFEADSLGDFRDELVRLAAFDPCLCERLLDWIVRSRYYMGSHHPFEFLLDDADRQELHSMMRPLTQVRPENPWTRRFSDLFSFFRRRRGFVTGGEPSARARRYRSEDFTAQGIRRFVQRCMNQQYESPGHVDSELEKSVAQLYASGAADAIKYLLERSDPATLRMFTDRYLDAERLADQATVRVVVRPADDSVTITGNTGRFLVYLQKDGWHEVRLSFTNQASMVYYLMYLIHHCHHPECKSPVSLSRNRDEFMWLYHRVYQISDEKLEERVYRMLYREVDGNLRVGRENELRRDIRHHLEDAFSEFSESHQPYAMTARTHLTVPQELLIFEGEAEELLEHFDFH